MSGHLLGSLRRMTRWASLEGGWPLVKEKRAVAGVDCESNSAGVKLRSRSISTAVFYHVSSTTTAVPVISGHALPINKEPRDNLRVPIMSHERDHPVRQQCPDFAQNNGARASGQECRIS